MRKTVIGVIVILALSATGYALWDRVQKKAAEKAKDDAKTNVTLEFAPREVVRMTAVVMPTIVEFSGPLVAPQSATVRAKAAGTLLSLAVGEGSRVNAGQVLGLIDLSELNSRLNERQAMLESAKASLAQAERSMASNQSLADQQFISANALVASRSTLETARAQVRASQAQLDTLKVLQRDAALVAPISGLVAKRLALPGEKLSPEQPVLSIVSLVNLELAGNVGTHEVSLLKPGMAVKVKAEGLVQAMHGTIARIAPAADPGTRSIVVAVTVLNPGEVLRAGQFAAARVEVADARSRPSLPQAAVLGGSGREFVWTIEDGKLVRRVVTTGRLDPVNLRVEVLSGLEPDAVVLGLLFENLAEGRKAVVTEKKSAVPAKP